MLSCCLLYFMETRTMSNSSHIVEPHRVASRSLEADCDDDDDDDDGVETGGYLILLLDTTWPPQCMGLASVSMTLSKITANNIQCKLSTVHFQSKQQVVLVTLSGSKVLQTFSKGLLKIFFGLVAFSFIF
ncbi:hypothetical protein CHARACLAT_005641 [Characodon lateralis]|uniref:Uncharacterized protein n=1 Tax=Characodon lateralis TaxID=208331 RepID=A0ABU7CYT3_9TELE|nr:hypothetical protein [Characodon lateralis]